MIWELGGGGVGRHLTPSLSSDILGVVTFSRHECLLEIAERAWWIKWQHERPGVVPRHGGLSAHQRGTDCV